MNSNFAYPLGVAVSSTFFLLYLGFKVGGQRKVAGVPYPFCILVHHHLMTSVRGKVRNWKGWSQGFVQLLSESSSKYSWKLSNFPRLVDRVINWSSDSSCCIWIDLVDWKILLCSRVILVLSMTNSRYYTGKPKNRVRGAISYLGLLAMLGLSIKTIVSLALNWRNIFSYAT